MRSITCTLVAILLAPGASSAAQPAPLSSGARVRVTSLQPVPEHKVGTVVAVRAGSIVLRPDGRTDTLAVPLDQVATVEVSRGWQNNGLRGMGIGFVTGALVGSLLALTDAGDSSDSSVQFSTGQKLLVIGGALGTAGAIIGGLAGAATRSERWTRVPLAGVASHVGVAPRAGGLALSVSARL